jgi:hypothetical protein
VSDAKIPKVICDRCMKAADVDLVATDQWHEYFHVRCHDEEQLLPKSAINKHVLYDGIPTLVWSNLKGDFISDDRLDQSEVEVLGTIFESAERLKLFHRVHRSHGAAPVYGARGSIDETIDTLLLFRSDDPNVPTVATPRKPVPVKPAPPREPGTCPKCTHHDTSPLRRSNRITCRSCGNTWTEPAS